MKQLTNKYLHKLLCSGRECIAWVWLALASCTGHTAPDALAQPETPADEEPGTMKFQVIHPDASSRATETGFEANDSIGLFIAEQGRLLQPGGNYVNNAKLTYADSRWKTEEPVYWNGGTYDVYAYAPYVQAVSSTSDYPFRVATDQQTGRGYNASDFLFAVAKNQTASASPVALRFKHCMSRVCIRLVKGADYDGDLPDDAVVYVHNTVPQATIDLTAGVATKYMYGTETTLTARNEGNHSYGAIVVPQRIDRRRPLFEVVMQGVSYLIEDNFVFRAGMCHTVSLVISKNPQQVKIEIGGEIENWN